MARDEHVEYPNDISSQIFEEY